MGCGAEKISWAVACFHRWLLFECDAICVELLSSAAAAQCRYICNETAARDGFAVDPK